MKNEDRLEKLLGYANPYALSSPLLEPPASAKDFIDHDPKTRRWLFDERGIQLNEKEIAESIERDTSPIPATQNREGYNGDDHYTFWLSGFVTYKQLSAIAFTNGVEGGAYLDFGGSTGRVFRHFHYQSDRWRVASCDFKMSSVEFNLKYFPKQIEVFQNNYYPVLPIESNSLNLISAMSVFTHIDETETSWLMELRRILRPGGLLLATVHDEYTWRASKILRDNAIKLQPSWTPERGWTDQAMPDGRHVATWRVDDPYRCNVFQSQSYLRSQWGRFLDVIDIMPCTFGAQTMVVLRKR